MPACVYGFNGGNDYGTTGYYANGDQFNLYAGATMNTPWKQLTTGVAFDYVQNYLGGGLTSATHGITMSPLLACMALLKPLTN